MHSDSFLENESVSSSGIHNSYQSMPSSDSKHSHSHSVTHSHSHSDAAEQEQALVSRNMYVPAWLPCSTWCNRQSDGDRRIFILISIIFSVLLIVSILIMISPQSTPPSLPSMMATSRPSFHYTSAKNWLNDPYGFIFHDGFYHMFYQHNPFATVWGPMYWGHAVSTDMLHWKHRPIAMSPTAGTSNAYGCWDGRVIYDAASPHSSQSSTGVFVVYTGVTQQHQRGFNFTQTQMYATPTDSSLDQWTQNPTPVLTIADTPNVNLSAFRDPFLFANEAVDNSYYAIIGSGYEHGGKSTLSDNSFPATLLLYSSTTFGQSWQYEGVFLEADPVVMGHIFETPNFFKLDANNYLLTIGKNDDFTARYYLGTWDPSTPAKPFQPSDTGYFDFGAVYAPSGLIDQTGRLLMVGWVQENDLRPKNSSSDQLKWDGWAGMMTVTRHLLVDPSDPSVLLIRPIAELEQQRIYSTFCDMPESLPAPHDNFLCHGFQSTTVDIEVVLSGTNLFTAASSPIIRVLSSQDGKQRTSVIVKDTQVCIEEFNNANLPQTPGLIACADLPTSFTQATQTLSLRIIVDRGVVEVYIHDRFVVTARVYPKSLERSHVGFAVQGALSDIAFDSFDMHWISKTL
jgi:beta-fructofuranosidase